MENKIYGKRLKQFCEKDRERVKELVEEIKTAYSQVYAHYVNNFLTGLKGSIQLYGEDKDKNSLVNDIEDYLPRIDNLISVMDKLRNKKFEEFNMKKSSNDFSMLRKINFSDIEKKIAHSFDDIIDQIDKEI